MVAGEYELLKVTGTPRSYKSRSSLIDDCFPGMLVEKQRCNVYVKRIKPLCVPTGIDRRRLNRTPVDTDSIVERSVALGRPCPKSVGMSLLEIDRKYLELAVLVRSLSHALVAETHHRRLDCTQFSSVLQTNSRSPTWIQLATSVFHLQCRQSQSIERAVLHGLLSALISMMLSDGDSPS